MNLYLHHATAEFGRLFENQDFRDSSCERFEAIFKLMKYTAQNLTNRRDGIDIEILNREFWSRACEIDFPARHRKADSTTEAAKHRATNPLSDCFIPGFLIRTYGAEWAALYPSPRIEQI